MSEYDPNYVEVKHWYLIGVKVVIINEKDEVLLLKRSHLTPKPGGLDLPGGGMDDNESPEEAAIRETIEETGIVITEAKVISSGTSQGHSDPWVLLGFVAHVSEVEVVLSWEHESYTWVSIANIETQDLPEDYKQIVRAAI